MKRFSQSLQKEMDGVLRSIHSRQNEPLNFCVPAITAMVEILERLKTFVIDYEFDGAEEEILFFRSVKPLFTSRLIYYQEIYRIELSMPVGDKETSLAYYRAEMRKLKLFFDNHLEFYRYHRSGETFLDDKYFRRNKFDYTMVHDLANIQADSRFTTTHDYTLAHLLANEDLRSYLEVRLNPHEKTEGVATRPLRELVWTGSKVALVELVYALHAERVFNSGNLHLKDIVVLFEEVFRVDLGQYHKTFLEIRERKSERTKFLLSLRESLVQRMEHTDDM